MSRVHGPVDRYSGRSTVDSRPGRGGVLTGTWRWWEVAAEHLKKEGTEGNLTTALVGTRAARFAQAKARQSGGRPSSMGVQYGCGWSGPM
jgi:hypothetical protein